MEAVDDFQDLSDESSALRINASWENDIHGYRVSVGVITGGLRCLRHPLAAD